MVYCKLLFDHQIPMRQYITQEITKSMPIMRVMLEEHLESLPDKKAKQAMKEKIGDLPATSPYLFFIQGLCLLMGEDFYVKEQDVSLL